MQKKIDGVPQFECKACYWSGALSEVRQIELHAETILDPAEYEWYCPDCNRAMIEEKEDDRIYCRVCEDIEVKDEHDLCGECYMARAEDQADRIRGH